MRTYSTAKVAKILGVGAETLYRWMHTGKIPAPPIRSFEGMTIRLWSESEIEQAKKYKERHYWGKGNKKKRIKAK